MYLHDADLLEMNIQFKDTTIELVMERYNDERADYDRIRMLFGGVFNLHISETICKIPEIENIYDCDLDEKSIKLEVLQKCGPSGEIKFEFKSYLALNPITCVTS